MEVFLSFIQDAVLTVIKVATPEIVKHLFARLKERTAPTANRDGSDSSNK